MANDLQNTENKSIQDTSTKVSPEETAAIEYTYFYLHGLLAEYGRLSDKLFPSAGTHIPEKRAKQLRLHKNPHMNKFDRIEQLLTKVGFDTKRVRMNPGLWEDELKTTLRRMHPKAAQQTE